MTTTDRGARLRAVQAAGAAATLLALPGSAAAADPPSPHDAALRAPIAGHFTVAGQMRAAGRAYEQRRLRRVADQLARRVDRAEGRRPSHARLRGESPGELRGRIAALRRELRAVKRGRTVSPARRDAPSSRSPSATIHAALQAIAACESGGNPRAIGGGGLYRGKYQFDAGTWASVGGTGDPAAAPEAEQDMRAARLYARAGATPWPACGG